MLNGGGPGREVLVKNVAVEPDAAFPGDSRGVGIDAHLLELAHIAPELEGTDLQKIAEEHAALESILEAQPQVVILLGLARCDSMHFIPLLLHVAPPRDSFSLHALRENITIPNSMHRRFDTRSLASRRSCAPSSDRSSRSSRETDSARPDRASRRRSVESAGWR